MKCSEAQNYIMRYFDREINDIEEAQLKQHFKNCNKCYEEFCSLKDIFAIVEEDTEVSPPEDFERQVMNRIEKEAVIYKKASNKKPVNDSIFAYNILLIAVSFIFTTFFGDILMDYFKTPIDIHQFIQHAEIELKEWISAAVSMGRGLIIAMVAITASLYKTYYYAYIALAILLLMIQKAFFKMVKKSNGGTEWEK